MCIGGVLLCPVAPMCCGWMCQKRASHAAYMQNDSIFTAKRYNRCAGAHAYLHAHTPSLLPALSPRLPLTGEHMRAGLPPSRRTRRWAAGPQTTTTASTSKATRATLPSLRGAGAPMTRTPPRSALAMPMPTTMASSLAARGGRRSRISRCVSCVACLVSSRCPLSVTLMGSPTGLSPACCCQHGHAANDERVCLWCWQMQGVASEQGTPGSNDWRARARAYSQ